MIALGIDTAGRKHVLGSREGATETAAVSAALNDLVTRGLPTERAMLFLVGSGNMKRTPHHFASSIFVFSSFRCRHVSIRRFGHVTCPSQLLGW